MPTPPATAPSPRAGAAWGRGPWTALLASVLLAGGAACTGGVAGTDEASSPCTVVDLIVEPDALDVHRDLAESFDSSPDHRLSDGGCARVRVRAMTPDRVAERLLDGWSEADDGPAPAMWSPGWSAWVDRVDSARAGDGQEPVTGERVAVMASPLVLGMPVAVGEAIGHPARSVGWTDLVRLSEDPQGWAAYGHPEWGQLRTGKTDPRVASDGLAALVAQAHAAHAGGGVVAADVLTDPTVEDHVAILERSVVHYGETAGPFLDRWERAEDVVDVASLAIPIVEERRIVTHEATLAEGADEEAPPATDLVAIPPAEGTVVLDHPVVELTTGWVTERQALARRAYLDHLDSDAARTVARDAGFRRPDLTFAPGSPATPAAGVDPERPVIGITIPEPTTIDALLDLWPDVRRGSRVVILVDASASTGQPATPGGPTRLAVLRDALGPATDRLDDDTEVALWTFDMDRDDGPAETHEELVAEATIGDVRDDLDAALTALSPGHGTPLYRTVTQALAATAEGYDPNRINSVLVISDGVNADGDAADDADQLDDLVAVLADRSTGASADPIRVFPVAFGDTADMASLRRLARASHGTVFDARDTDDLAAVLAAVTRTI